MGREGLGEGRTAQPTPDLPGRQGGGGILSSFLHWVSNKQPGSGSLTSPGSRHVHRHLARGSASWLSSHGRGLGPLCGLEGVPGLPGAPQGEAGLTRKFETQLGILIEMYRE